MIKNKIIKHLLINGKKQTGEKILTKSIKELQKKSKKQSKTLIQLSIIKTLPIFKLHTISNKKNQKVKEIPSFIYNEPKRVSLAIKFILDATKKNSYNFFNSLEKEILSNSKSESNAINKKINLQMQVLLNKRYFLYYRWS